ncbi:MAG: hypothetical protein ACYTXA_04965 [Nostoc sp.]
MTNSVPCPSSEVQESEPLCPGECLRYLSQKSTVAQLIAAQLQQSPQLLIYRLIHPVYSGER